MRVNNVYRRVADRFASNIQTRLTGYFLLILLPLVIISLFAVERSRDILYEQAVKRTEVALSSAMNHFDLALQNVEEISTLIAADPNLNELLNKNGADFSPRSIVDFSNVLQQLSNSVSVNRFVSQISVYHQATHMFISTHFGGRKLASEPEQEWLVESARNNGTGISYVMADYPVSDARTFGKLTGTDSVSLIRSMDLYNMDRQSNLLVVTFNRSKLLNILKTLLPSENSRVSLFNERGEVIVETGKAAASGAPSSKDMEVSMDSEYSSWRLVLVQPKSELYRETDQLRLFTFTIIGISILLAFIISWVVYSGIASPVLKLSRGMRCLSSGEMNVHVETRRKDEFGFLIQSFNRMVSVQKHLIEDHYEQQLRLTTTELKFLQSQINPHFLYNTLDSIYWAAKNYEEDEISEMVMNLSKFFRLSLDKGRQVFTVEESINHLHYYIRIQQLRFLDSFEVEYRISDETKALRVLKLLLQPLVENAILHGLEGKESGGRLIVSSRIEQSTVVISVQNNGPEIGEERLSYIRSELGRMRSRSFPSLSQDEENIKDLFGLRNVFTRMRLYYGEEADLTIESTSGTGTVVAIRIPVNPAGSGSMEPDAVLVPRQRPEIQDRGRAYDPYEGGREF
ncbi:two-component sensor histidine kinase [Paenibacillus selenitireducens]|uniref:Two-component sensor histidine kinase n=1 Tax=Paenibacillus selenitireducens TaxID=1324314 RepID=A0A1T2WZB6_9BACL|nr:sensor histidine kinase [Paenibacillus selenitireducens]OPA72967.1 two-component sensor histidine kinase [Paenibacillus selenitireducens]